jgi:hypothetical protein
MSYESVFGLINAVVLPAWALLILAPRWRLTQPAAHLVTVPVIAAAYVALVAYALGTGGGAEGVDFTTLDGVAAIFSHPLGVTTGWAHYLAFDLFVGAWVGRDARVRGVPHLLVVPCLILCFLAGPAGLLLYLSLRLTRRGRLRRGA